jgi:hypothetical protein
MFLKTENIFFEIGSFHYNEVIKLLIHKFLIAHISKQLGFFWTFWTLFFEKIVNENHFSMNQVPQENWKNTF